MFRIYKKVNKKVVDRVENVFIRIEDLNWICRENLRIGIENLVNTELFKVKKIIQKKVIEIKKGLNWILSILVVLILSRIFVIEDENDLEVNIVTIANVLDTNDFKIKKIGKIEELK